MTSVEVPVAVWCWPGPRAAAGAQVGPSGEPVLAVFLDPVNLVVTVPPFPDGPIGMARFMRELARAAAHVADVIEPARRPGAHRALDTGPGEAEVPTW